MPGGQEGTATPVLQPFLLDHQFDYWVARIIVAESGYCVLEDSGDMGEVRGGSAVKFNGERREGLTNLLSTKPVAYIPIFKI